MAYLTGPLSAAQIHSVYATDKNKPASSPAAEAKTQSYSKTSFAGRDPGHPGSPPPPPEPAGKKKRR
jgi:hypothetical protein